MWKRQSSVGLPVRLSLRLPAPSAFCLKSWIQNDGVLSQAYTACSPQADCFSWVKKLSLHLLTFNQMWVVKQRTAHVLRAWAERRAPRLQGGYILKHTFTFVHFSSTRCLLIFLINMINWQWAMWRCGRSCSSHFSGTHPSGRLAAVICLRVEKQILQPGLAASMEMSEWLTCSRQERGSVGVRPWRMTNGIDRLGDIGTAGWLPHLILFFSSLLSENRSMSTGGLQFGSSQLLSWLQPCHPLMWFPALHLPFKLHLPSLVCSGQWELFPWPQVSAHRCFKTLCSSLNNTWVS